MKELAVPVDQSGVRPEAGMWAPEERCSGQDPPALGYVCLHGEACSIALGPLGRPSKGPLLWGAPPGHTPVTLATELWHLSAQLPCATPLCF